MVGRIARLWLGFGHRFLLVVWRYLPLWARRLAIRLLYPRFAIGAAAFVRDDAGRVLLVRQTYHRDGPLWAAPGGWVDRGENPRQAAVRETYEETGLRVTAGRLLEVDGGPYGEVSLVFECQIVDDGGFQPGPETDRIGYFSPASFPSMTVETRRLLERTIAVQEQWRAVSSIQAVEAADRASV
jgi:ADP-ribose pyrophosphatase YjhB (NUDIX family)